MADPTWNDKNKAAAGANPVASPPTAPSWGAAVQTAVQQKAAQNAPATDPYKPKPVAVPKAKGNVGPTRYNYETPPTTEPVDQPAVKPPEAAKPAKPTDTWEMPKPPDMAAKPAPVPASGDDSVTLLPSQPIIERPDQPSTGNTYRRPPRKGHDEAQLQRQWAYEDALAAATEAETQGLRASGQERQASEALKGQTIPVEILLTQAARAVSTERQKRLASGQLQPMSPEEGQAAAEARLDQMAKAAGAVSWADYTAEARRRGIPLDSMAAQVARNAAEQLMGEDEAYRREANQPVDGMRTRAVAKPPVNLGSPADMEKKLVREQVEAAKGRGVDLQATQPRLMTADVRSPDTLDIAKAPDSMGVMGGPETAADPLVSKPGEVGYQTAERIIAAAEDHGVTGSYVNAISQDPGGYSRYVQDQVPKILKTWGVKNTDPDYDAQTLKARRQALNEVVAFKTVGVWTPPILISSETDPVSGWNAFKPKIEVVGFGAPSENGKPIIVTRQQGITSYAFDVMDFLQMGAVGAWKYGQEERQKAAAEGEPIGGLRAAARGAVKGIGQREDIFTAAMASPDSQARQVYNEDGSLALDENGNPIMTEKWRPWVYGALGLAGAIASPDLSELVVMPAASRLLKKVGTVAEARKAEQAAKLLDEIAAARRAGSVKLEEALAAEKRVDELRRLAESTPEDIQAAHVEARRLRGEANAILSNASARESTLFVQQNNLARHLDAADAAVARDTLGNAPMIADPTVARRIPGQEEALLTLHPSIRKPAKTVEVAESGKGAVKAIPIGRKDLFDTQDQITRIERAFDDTDPARAAEIQRHVFAVNARPIVERVEQLAPDLKPLLSDSRVITDPVAWRAEALKAAAAVAPENREAVARDLLALYRQGENIDDAVMEAKHAAYRAIMANNGARATAADGLSQALKDRSRQVMSLHGERDAGELGRLADDPTVRLAEAEAGLAPELSEPGKAFEAQLRETGLSRSQANTAAQVMDMRARKAVYEGRAADVADWYRTTVHGEGGLDALAEAGEQTLHSGKGQEAWRRFFDQSAIDFAERQSRGNSRFAIVMMTPDEFLNLAEAGRSAAKEARVADILVSTGKFEDLPFLSVHETEGSQVAEVSGHEGRHRMQALKALGVEQVPVVVRMDHLRWNERAAEAAQWPTVLAAETPKFHGVAKSNFTMPFPESAVGRDGHLAASIGEQTLYSEGRRVNTDTPEFKRWFGESKVVNPDGSPMVMYHGSREKFDSFDKSKIREHDYDANYNGFWFSSDPLTSPAFAAAAETYPVYLSIKKPAHWPQVKQAIRDIRQTDVADRLRIAGARTEHDAVRMRLQELGYDGVIRHERPQFDIEQALRDGRVEWTDQYGRKHALVRETDPESLSHDGWDLYDIDRYGNEEHITGYRNPEEFLDSTDDTWVAFEPEQIKSVFNRGTFDPNDPRILYNVGRDTAIKRELIAELRALQAADETPEATQRIREIKQQLDAIEEMGQPLSREGRQAVRQAATAREAALALAEHARSPYAREIAQRLAEVMPSDVSFQVSLTRGGQAGEFKFGVSRASMDASGASRATFEPGRVIVQSPDDVETMLHEFTHAATANAIHRFMITPGMMSEEARQAVERLTALFNDVKGHPEIDKLVKASRHADYGLTDVHEFIAEAFANPDFQEVLRKIPANELLNPPAKAGVLRSVYDSLRDAIRRLIGIPTTVPDSALDTIMDAAPGVFKANQETVDELKLASWATQGKPFDKATAVETGLLYNRALQAVHPDLSRLAVPDGFFSPLQKALGRVFEKAGDRGVKADYLLREAMKQPGVKADELEWSGIAAWLREQGDRRVTSAEVAEEIAKREPVVQVAGLQSAEASKALRAAGERLAEADRRMSGINTKLREIGIEGADKEDLEAAISYNVRRHRLAELEAQHAQAQAAYSAAVASIRERGAVDAPTFERISAENSRASKAFFDAQRDIETDPVVLYPSMKALADRIQAQPNVQELIAEAAAAQKESHDAQDAFIAAQEETGGTRFGGYVAPGPSSNYREIRLLQQNPGDPVFDAAIKKRREAVESVLPEWRDARNALLADINDLRVPVDHPDAADWLFDLQSVKRQVKNSAPYDNFSLSYNDADLRDLANIVNGAAPDLADRLIRFKNADEARATAARLPIPKRVVAGPGDGVFQHFEPNTIAHLRTTDRVGPHGERILFVEEVQSDWHQAGKKHGYAGDSLPSIEALKRARDDAKNLRSEAIKARNFAETELEETWNRQYPGRAPEFYEKLEAIRREKPREVLQANLSAAQKVVDEAEARYFEADSAWRLASDNPRVNPGSHSELWRELALKQALNIAAKEGYDGVALTRGEIIQSVVGGEEEGQQVFYNQMLPKTLEKVAGERIGSTTIGMMTESEAHELEILRKNLAEDEANLERMKAAGMDLGRDVVDKFIARHITKPKEQIARLEAKAAERVPYIAVTPRLRDRVMNEGLSLYSGKAGKPVDAAETAVADLQDRVTDLVRQRRDTKAETETRAAIDRQLNEARQALKDAKAEAAAAKREAQAAERQTAKDRMSQLSRDPRVKQANARVSAAKRELKDAIAAEQEAATALAKSKAEKESAAVQRRKVALWQAAGAQVAAKRRNVEEVEGIFERAVQDAANEAQATDATEAVVRPEAKPEATPAVEPVEATEVMPKPAATPEPPELTEVAGEPTVATPEATRVVEPEPTVRSEPTIPSAAPEPAPEPASAASEAAITLSAFSSSDPEMALRDLAGVLQSDLTLEERQALAAAGLADPTAFANAFIAWAKDPTSASKAVSPAMGAAAGWLRDAFRTVKAADGTAISPEVSAAFSQLLGLRQSDEAIEAARQAASAAHEAARPKAVGFFKGLMGPDYQARRLNLFDELAKAGNAQGIPLDAKELRRSYETTGRIDLPAPLFGRVSYDAKGLADLQAKLEDVALAALKRNPAKLTLDDPARMIVEETAIDKAWNALRSEKLAAETVDEAGDPIALMTRAGNLADEGVKAIGRFSLTLATGQDEMKDLRHLAPQVREPIVGAVRVINIAYADAQRIMVDYGVDGLIRYLMGERMTFRSGRRAVSSGWDSASVLRMRLMDTVSRVDSGDLAVLTGASDLANLSPEASAAASRAAADLLYRRANLFTKQLGEIIGISQPLNRSADLNLTVKELLLAKTLTIYTRMNPEDGLRMLSRGVSGLYGPEAGHRVLMLMAGHGQLGRLAKTWYNAGLLIPTEDAALFKTWLMGEQITEAQMKRVAKVADSLGFDPNFVPGQQLLGDTDMPKAAHDRLMSALTKATPEKPHFLMADPTDLNAKHGLRDSLLTYIKWRKSSQVRGSLLKRTRFVFGNSVDQIHMTAARLGLGPAFAAAIRTSGQYATVLAPGVQRLVDVAQRFGLTSPDALEKMRDVVQSWGDTASHAFSRMVFNNITSLEMNKLMDGADEVLYIPKTGQFYHYGQLRQTFMESGVSEGLAKNIESAFKRSVEPPTGLKGRAAERVASYMEYVEDCLDAVNERERFGQALTLVELGVPPRMAGQLTTQALFDYTTSMTGAERSWLMNLFLPYWAFIKNATRATINSMFSPWQAHRLALLRRATEYGADAAAELAYGWITDPYGIDVSALTEEGYANYLTMRETIEGRYGGVEKVPMDVKLAVRAAFGGNSSYMIDKGRIFEFTSRVGELLRDTQADARLKDKDGRPARMDTESAYIPRPDRSGEPTYTREFFALPLPSRMNPGETPRRLAKGEARSNMQRYMDLASPDHPFIELLLPETYVQSGLRQSLGVAAGLVEAVTAGINLGVGVVTHSPTTMDTAGQAYFTYENLMRQIVDPERALVLPDAAKELFGMGDPPPYHVHAIIGEALTGLGISHLEVDAAKDPFQVSLETGEPVDPELADRLAAAAAANQLPPGEEGAGAGLKATRHYIPSFWGQVARSIPGFEEFNKALLNYNDYLDLHPGASPLERAASPEYRAVVTAARNITGVMTVEPHRSLDALREEPRRATDTTKLPERQ